MSSNIFRPNGGTPIIAEKAVMGFSGTDISAVLFLPQFELDNFDRLANYQKDVPDILRNRGPLAYKLGAIQTLTYSVYDEKTPIRSLGFKNPMGMARGNRTIAGSLIFGQLFNHVFDDAGQVRRARVVEDTGGILSYSAGSITYLDWEDESDKAYREQLVNRRHQYDFTWDSGGFGERLKISEVPPFDIILLFVNEMGNVGKMILYGIEIVHESGVLSIDDIYTEVTYQYVARDIEIFHPASFDQGRSWRSRSWESPANRNKPKILDVALAVDAASDRLNNATELAEALSNQADDSSIIEEEVPEAERLFSLWSVMDPGEQNTVASVTGLGLSSAEILVSQGNFLSGQTYFSFGYHQDETQLNLYAALAEDKSFGFLVDLINRTNNRINIKTDMFNALRAASSVTNTFFTDIQGNTWNYSIFEVDENTIRNVVSEVESDGENEVVPTTRILDIFNNPWNHPLQFINQSNYILSTEEFIPPSELYASFIELNGEFVSTSQFISEIRGDSARLAVRNLINRVASQAGIRGYDRFEVQGNMLTSTVSDPNSINDFEASYRVAVRSSGSVRIRFFEGSSEVGVVAIR